MLRLLALVISFLLLPTHAQDSCEMEKYEGMRLQSVREPAEVLLQSSDMASEQDCYQECCNRYTENCNMASYFNYNGVMVCLLARCSPWDTCELAPAVGARYGKFLSRDGDATQEVLEQPILDLQNSTDEVGVDEVLPLLDAAPIATQDDGSAPSEIIEAVNPDQMVPDQMATESVADPVAVPESQSILGEEDPMFVTNVTQGEDQGYQDIPDLSSVPRVGDAGVDPSAVAGYEDESPNRTVTALPVEEEDSTVTAQTTETYSTTDSGWLDWWPFGGGASDEGDEEVGDDGEWTEEDEKELEAEDAAYEKEWEEEEEGAEAGEAGEDMDHYEGQAGEASDWTAEDEAEWEKEEEEIEKEWEEEEAAYEKEWEDGESEEAWAGTEGVDGETPQVEGQDAGVEAGADFSDDTWTEEDETEWEEEEKEWEEEEEEWDEEWEKEWEEWDAEHNDTTQEWGTESINWTTTASTQDLGQGQDTNVEGAPESEWELPEDWAGQAELPPMQEGLPAETPAAADAVYPDRWEDDPAAHKPLTGLVDSDLSGDAQEEDTDFWQSSSTMNAPIIALGACVAVIVIMLLLIFLGKRMMGKNDRAQYKPLRESFSGSSTYHEDI